LSNENSKKSIECARHNAITTIIITTTNVPDITLFTIITNKSDSCFDQSEQGKQYFKLSVSVSLPMHCNSSQGTGSFGQ
jgi:hypothetical protein